MQLVLDPFVGSGAVLLAAVAIDETVILLTLSRYHY